jgi:hypothetical protein
MSDVIDKILDATQQPTPVTSSQQPRISDKRTPSKFVGVVLGLLA